MNALSSMNSSQMLALLSHTHGGGCPDRAEGLTGFEVSRRMMAASSVPHFLLGILVLLDSRVLTFIGCSASSKVWIQFLNDLGRAGTSTIQQGLHSRSFWEISDLEKQEISKCRAIEAHILCDVPQQSRSALCFQSLT